jgi:hypothetical protein
VNHLPGPIHTRLLHIHRSVPIRLLVRAARQRALLSVASVPPCETSPAPAADREIQSFTLSKIHLDPETSHLYRCSITSDVVCSPNLDFPMDFHRSNAPVGPLLTYHSSLSLTVLSVLTRPEKTTSSNPHKSLQINNLYDFKSPNTPFRPRAQPLELTHPKEDCSALSPAPHVPILLSAGASNSLVLQPCPRLTAAERF